jgi:hypothetical protein
MWRSLRLLLSLLALVVPAGEATALNDSRSVEFDNGVETVTYDLKTVQMLDPAKFTIWGAPYPRMAFIDASGVDEDPSFFDCEGSAVESQTKEYAQSAFDFHQ